MPTYVYRCDACGHQFELFQRMSDDPVDTCPKCQQAVRRVIHPVGVVFKGSGWYINDSRAKNSANGSSETKTDESSGSNADGGAGKSESAASEPVKTAAD